MRLSTGDRLSAWITKVCFFVCFYFVEFLQGLHFPSSYIQITHRNPRRYPCRTRHPSAGFFRKIWIHYPQNCFIPLPVPRLTVEEIRSTPVHKLAYNVTTVRDSLFISEPVRLYRDLFTAVEPSKTKAILLYMTDCQMRLSSSLTRHPLVPPKSTGLLPVEERQFVDTKSWMDIRSRCRILWISQGSCQMAVQCLMLWWIKRRWEWYRKSKGKQKRKYNIFSFWLLPPSSLSLLMSSLVENGSGTGWTGIQAHLGKCWFSHESLFPLLDLVRRYSRYN